MTEKLRVLVVESERHAADMAIEELAKAGHTVARCTQPGEASFPCAALREGCPLRDKRAVDVVLDVRRRSRSQPAPGEIGVSCALQQHIPLVVAGGTVLNPFAEWATEMLEDPFDVVPACERAARQALPRHTECAAHAVHRVLESRGFDPSTASVNVYRRHGGLAVRVHSTTALPRDVKTMASVRIMAALREFDSYASGIDVMFESNS